MPKPKTKRPKKKSLKSLNVPPELHERLTSYAKEHDKKLGAMVARILDEALRVSA